MPILQNFNDNNRDKKFHVLGNLMGIRDSLVADPDPNYELTLDNCLKMIAIFLRDAEELARQNHQVICSIWSDWFLAEILKCQNVFMDEINLEKKNIANNFALLENVVMMIICIELRIPLFIVGKPGSSKSLTKSIVSRTMEGRNSKSELFKNLKEKPIL